MDIKKNHKKHFNLKSFDEVTENTYINEKTGILIKFHDNDYVQEKINYLIEDIVDERAPLRHQSYNDNPSEVFYDTEGNLSKLNYSEMGKLHSVGGHYLFDKKNGISYWMNGQRNDDSVKKIFLFFGVSFNKEGADKLFPFIKIFYKSPEKIEEFLEILKSLEIDSFECDIEKRELLEISYF